MKLVINSRAWRCLQAFGAASVLVLLLAGCGADSAPSQSDSSAESRSNTITPPAPASAPAAVIKPEFLKLVGKWLRPDGGYVLELKAVTADGVFQAGYFNPNPINVSKARALQDGTTTKVFVELRDVNYPGCTYSLTYDTKTDQLYGQYFQASMQETYDITFERLKD